MIPFSDENPTRTFPLIVVAIIAANVVVSIYQFMLPQADQIRFLYVHGAIPGVLLGKYTLSQVVPREAYAGPYGAPVTAMHPIWLSVFSSMFLHGGFWHLAGNMLYLWVFGNNIEDVLGHFRFLVFYLFCGLIAAGTQIGLSLGSPVPMIGASGAIAGVLGAYYMKFPRARVRCLVFLFFFITVIMVPAGFVLLLWFLMQVWSSLQPHSVHGGGVAFFAHIGGFIAGWALVRRFQPRRPRLLDWG
jgi:membrane associated rhomboid family serine protease